MKRIPLWNTIPGGYTEEPVLECYFPEVQSSKTAVVLLPGGGYEYLAEHEGKGFAEFLNRNGIAAFVCRYRVYPHLFPMPLLDARRAVRYVRHHAREFGIDPGSIYVMGSSAGGHLAALTATFEEPLPYEGADELDQVSPRPDGQILCYPVINLLGIHTHWGSGDHLLGGDLQAAGNRLSPDLIATKNTPKAFIWHTFQDGLVSAIHSLDYARRLRELEIPVEMHIYPEGHHGLGLAEGCPRAEQWTEQLIGWIRYNER